MKDEVKKCPECGVNMQLVGHIDKDTKEELVGMQTSGTGKCSIAGGFLSGSLRKYKCPNGHESTN